MNSSAGYTRALMTGSILLSHMFMLAGRRWTMKRSMRDPQFSSQKTVELVTSHAAIIQCPKALEHLGIQIVSRRGNTSRGLVVTRTAVAKR